MIRVDAVLRREFRSAPEANGGKGRRGVDHVAPLPPPIATVALEDAMSAIVALLVKQREAGVRAGEDQVHVRDGLAEKHLEALREAIQRASEADGGGGFFDSITGLVGDLLRDVADLRFADAARDTAGNLEATWNDPRFWRDLEKAATWVAKIAAAVGAVALTTVTFGGAAPAVVLAALALSAGGFAVAETRCFGDKASPWVALGLDLAGAVLGGGGALAQSGSRTFLRAVGTAGAVSQMAGGAAQMTQGAAHVRVAGFEADAQRAEADMTAARQGIERQGRFVAWLLEGLEATVRSNERALDRLSGAVRTLQDTRLAAGAARG